MMGIIRIVLAALFLAVAVTGVQAEERIPFVEGDLHGDDWPTGSKSRGISPPNIRS